MASTRSFNARPTYGLKGLRLNQASGIETPRWLIIKHDQIGIISGCDRAFAAIQASQPRGARHIHSTSFSSPIPCVDAFCQTAGRLHQSEEMLPHAVRKLPLPNCFISGRHGE
jgi:hypothetical protein